MKFTYLPKGVCSQVFEFEIEGTTIQSVKITGGCPGNLLGISHLIEGKEIDEVIERLQGVPCGRKPTSCPDQISKALVQYKASL
ncbi:MAG: TIGR03905 family TSCPD domain-containing protein [Erysipelotrichaceae bacterium]|nr:TIGR03905 family TSCPD domain-containing protein [Erysipelotrichaceae bacterium]